MFEEELPESDSSDDDFVPDGERSEVSEEESDGDIEATDQQEETSKRKKSLKTNKCNRKKKKSDETEKDADKEEVKEVKTAEEQKKHVDSLWADFLKDCGPVVKKKTEPSQNECSNSKVESVNTVSNNKSDDDIVKHKTDESRSPLFPDDKEKVDGESSTDKNVEVYEFAGEKVVVEKKMDPRRRPPVSRGGGGGVAAILSQINKKNKLSTLEKSKLDWDTFKEKEGITEQLSAHNRGKNGYLEKQDFLERSDHRQFEIEKEMRAYNRSKRL